MSLADVTASGADALWGSGIGNAPQVERRGAGVGGLGASTYEAATDAYQISMEAAALLQVVRANKAKFPPDYIALFDAWLTAWDGFINHVSGRKLKWYELQKKMATSWTGLFYGPEIYNSVIDYRRKFNILWDTASKILGQPATAVKPDPPKAKVSTQPVTDTFNKIVTGVIIVGVVGAGLYLYTHHQDRAAMVAGRSK